MQKLFIITLFSIYLLNVSCEHVPLYPAYNSGCDPDSIYFNRDIMPIFLTSCAYDGCHSARSRAEGIVLNNFDNIINSGVHAKHPMESRVYQSIISPVNRMPPGNKLSKKERKLIYWWIKQGANNVNCNSCDTNSFAFSENISPVLNKYCVACHSTSNPQAGVILSDYEHVTQYIDNGSLEGSIKGSPGFNQMPPGGSISDCEITQIENWINNGAQND